MVTGTPRVGVALRALLTLSCALVAACGDDVDETGSTSHPVGADASAEEAARVVRDAGVVVDASVDAAAPDGSLPDEPVPTAVDFERIGTYDLQGQRFTPEKITGLIFVPDGGALIWNKLGRVMRFDLTDDGVLMLRGEVTLPDVFTQQDCGLVSLALDPQLQDQLYVGHCVSATHSEVRRYALGERSLPDVDAGHALVIRLGDDDAVESQHNVGTIGFFPDADASMWVLVGDKRLSEHGQRTASQLGAVLRVIPERGDGGEGYAPHPDNPFAGPGADSASSSGPDLYAWGLRSPWRGELDRHGNLWIGDVGARRDEVNVVREAGQNFGWATVDGPCREDDCTPFTDPVTNWSRASDHLYRVEDPASAGSSGQCATLLPTYRPDGEDVYRGMLDEGVLFADACTGFVRQLKIDADGEVVSDEPVGHLTGVAGGDQHSDGHLYVASYGHCLHTRGTTAGIYRVVPRGVEAPSQTPADDASGGNLVEDPLAAFPRKLSATGLFEGERLETPVASALAYEPAWPLWSGGTLKARFLLLPEGATIDNRARTSWSFPVGTLLVKTFSWRPDGGEERRLETRIMRRSEEGWDFQVYAWHDKGADPDADRLTMEQPVVVPLEPEDEGGDSHTIPSRADCRACHESNRTPVIGFDELGLGGPLAGSKAPQLQALHGAGVFDEAPPESPRRVRHEDALTQRVLGYLHGNCAHCHNDSDRSMSALSLEHEVALANVIDRPAEASGQASGIRVVPGAPDESLLFRAFAREDMDAELVWMPPIGVDRTDAEAVEMLREWIGALAEDGEE